MDPFENFEQQERSYSYLKEHGEKLAAEAAREIGRSPGSELAGIILEAGASEYKQIRTAIEQGLGIEVTDPVFVQIVPRELALLILTANASQDALDWVAKNAPPFARRLPIIVAAKNGFRMGAVEIPLEDCT